MNAKQSILAIFAATATALCVTLPAFARPATLVAQDNGSRINVRNAPSTTATAPHYGVAGDRVEIQRATTGRDGYQWYYVQFASGAKGWVRGDFVRYQDGMTQYGVLGGKPGDRINVRSAASTKAASPHYGIQGDVVRVVSQKRGTDGYTWQFVQFPSGAKGWVRGDLVNMMDVGGC